LEDFPIPDDVLCDMVVQSIDDRNLPPLKGKRQRRIQNQDPPNTPKRTCIQYDYKHAEASVLSDWLGEVPCFPDKQFECTFRIKCHMVDTIINHLAKNDSFWIKTICSVGKEKINPYVKFPCAMKMLCCGASGSAFFYHQFGETTSRRCISKLSRGFV
jgi:hypothetical protein